MSSAAPLEPSASRKRPPGPGPLRFLQTQAEFMGNDQIGALRRVAQTYGPASAFWLGGFRTYLFTEPALIEEVLLDREGVFLKDAITHELEDLLGHGLLTSEGELWRRQRKLAAPALKRKQIEAYADWMVELTRREIAAWRDGTTIELHHAMMALTLKIVVKTLFNLEVEDEVGRIGAAIDDAMDVFHVHTNTPWRFVPRAIPTHYRRRFARAVAELDAMVFRLIEQRRRDPAEGDDLLSRLLAANDDDGEGMSDKQLRDEVITMFLAGHETTALAVTYTWYLLSLAPDSARHLFDEVDEVLGDRPATADDVGRLPYVRAVVQESMRLYPPAWIVGREASRDTIVGGWHVPRGTQVLTPQCVVHRDARWFDDPDTFRPERWLGGELERSIPRFAYFPFGGGPRVCIGNHFAMMEAILMVATIAQHWDMENMMSGPMETQPAVTLRPIVPVSMRLHAR